MIKNNKTALIVAGAIIIAVITLSIIISGGSKKISAGVNAVPPDAVAVFETDDILHIFDKLKNEKQFFMQATGTAMLSELFLDINFVDSLAKKDDDFEGFINSSNIVVSIHPTSKENVSSLFITGMKNKQTEKEVFKWLNKYTSDNKLKISKDNYSGAEIYKVNLQDSIQSLCFSSFDSYFLMSFSEILIEKSIRQINAGKSIAGKKDFNQIYKNSHSRADGHLFINYENFEQAMGSKLSKSGKNSLKHFGTFASWSAFDFNIRNKKIHLTGFTSVDEGYLSIFKGAEGVEEDVLDILPRQTSSFSVLGFTSGLEFKKNYKKYLLKNNLGTNYSRQIESFYSKYSIKESEQDFYRLVGESATAFYEDINKNGAAQRVYGALEVKDVDATERFFKLIITNYLKANKDKKAGEFFQQMKIGEDKVDVIKLPENNMLELFFGKAFEKLDGEFVTFFEDYAIFGNSPKSLKAYLENIKDGKIFSKRVDYKDLIYSLSSESNVLFFADLTHFKSEISKVFSKRRTKMYNADSEFLRNVKGPFIQYSANTSPAYTSIQLLFQETSETTSETVWELPGKSPFLTKPHILINHNTKNKEVFIQDEQNKIYLISADGAILWERQLSEKIESKVFQIDAYKNNKLQMFFNTKNSLHCYDRKGNYLEGYPIKLSSPATSPVNVLDYDHNKKYRIIIATKDKKVNLYNIKGKEIEGWKFEKTETEVNGAIQYFRNEGKDYILFHDKENTYITDRQGSIRVKPEYKFPVSMNAKYFFESQAGKNKARFVTSNIVGAVHYIYLDGKTSKSTIKNCGLNHYFLYEDIDGDGKKDYIFAENNKIEVFTKKNVLKYSLEFDSKITEMPSYYNFSESDKRLGIVTAGNSKIYLINGAGKISPNFPLTGSSRFSVGQLKKTDKFGLIVGSADKYLYKYNL